jgi:transposase, IS5 family
MISDRIPDETTILAFRHLLEKHDLGKQIFEVVKAHLKANGMAMKQGTIIDATLIAAPSSTKNEKKERDPEMHQTCKGKQWYFGMKVHIGVDSENGLIHSVETTAANVHDLTPAADLLHGEETVVYADASYQGIEKRDEMQGRGIGFRVAMRPGKRRVLPDTPEGQLDDLVETAKAHIRTNGEHPFRVIKQQFGFQKTRLRGMLKNRCKVNVLAALSNLFMARRRLLCSTCSGDWCPHRGQKSPDMVKIQFLKRLNQVNSASNPLKIVQSEQIAALNPHSRLVAQSFLRAYSAVALYCRSSVEQMILRVLSNGISSPARGL